ncbi:hypothetical protein ACE6H2_024654 [Prunus campanulata]
MAMVSMLISLPTLTTPNSCRVNRYWQAPKRSSAMALASANTEIATTGVKFAEGEEKLPKVVLTSAGGSEADIYLFGGCITSWKVPSGRDLLFVRPDAVFNKKKPISGGVPHCFPQFGPGAIQQHGFARNLDWSVIDSENVQGDPAITLELKDGEYSRSMWDFSFQALYKVTKLLMRSNDCRDGVTFPGFVDCVYLEAPNELHLDNGLGDIISIKNTNWTDAVLWNPYLTMEACYKDFVCVENAKIGNVQLEPGHTWTATQHLSIN